MDTGLYITFFETGEPFDRELPPVGPLDHVVVRHKQLVAQRRQSGQAEMGGDIARWLEAEIEFQRATGDEPGGTKRTELRFAARDGVLLRFTVFGDTRERDPLPELGPFAVVVIGRRGIEADGQVLAKRASSELAPWELTSAAGPDAAGQHKPDVAFRTSSTAYHPQVGNMPQAAAPVVEPVVIAPVVEPVIIAPIVTEPVAPPPAARPPIMIGEAEAAAPAEPFVFKERERKATEIYSPPAQSAQRSAPPAPPAEEPPALTPSDLAMIERIEQQREEDTLRSRVLEEERRRLGVDEGDDSATTWSMRYRPSDDAAASVSAPEAGGLSIGAAAWRLRFAIIGVLLLLTGAYGFTVIRSGGTSTVPGQVAVQYVSIAQHFNSAAWDYVANGVQRQPTAGKAQARGTYYVVRLGVTNKTGENAPISPSQFVLVDANGVEHGAESTLSDAYYSPSNTQSQFVWPQTVPAGKTVSLSVVFDVEPSLGRGMLLKVADLPNVRVRLD